MNNIIIATIPPVSEEAKRWSRFLYQDTEYKKLCEIRSLYSNAFTPLQYQLSRSRSMRVLHELHKCEKANDAAREKLNELIDARIAVLREEFKKINK